MSKKETNYEKELITDHNRWNQLYKYGGSDPFWSDGCNLNLVRNHIIYDRERLEEQNQFPEAYYWEIPPEVDNGYMARADEILLHAAKALNVYRSDPNYQFLIENGNRISKKEAENISYGNVIGYVSGLQYYLEKAENASEREYSDILLCLRRHENPSGYQESFARCRRGLEVILEKCKDSLWNFMEEKNGQLSLF